MIGVSTNAQMGEERVLAKESTEGDLKLVRQGGAQRSEWQIYVDSNISHYHAQRHAPLHFLRHGISIV